MAHTFNRHLGKPHELRTGEFTVNTDDARAVLSCCMCGYIYRLPRHCNVDKTGRVPERFHCESAKCSWWDFAVLADHWLENP